MVPVHHLELLWDDATDRAVRAEWELLVGQDLPSQARHRGESNAPHTTLTMVEDWPDDVDGPVGDALGRLPLAASLGALTCFGGGPFTLVRPLVVTAALLDLHRDALAPLGPPARPFLRPGRWVPHVTLATRLGADQVGRAVAALAGSPAPTGHLVGARRWDAAARVVRPVGRARPGAHGT